MTHGFYLRLKQTRAAAFEMIQIQGKALVKETLVGRLLGASPLMLE